jgi:L-cystine uptake protein TcyP (sodium:dicarboxylate symporter family)
MFTLQNLSVVLALLVFAALIVFLAVLRRKLNAGFTTRVIVALLAGIAYGVVLQVLFGAGAASGTGGAIKNWVNIVGQVFTKALQFIIIPLVLVSIVRAISQFTKSSQGARQAGKIIGFLLVTTAISAVIAIIVTKIFGLSAAHLIDYTPSDYKPANIPTTILTLVPNNLFAALASNSVLPIVLIAALIGFAYLSIKKEAASVAIAGHFESFLETAYELVMRVVDFVIQFTPYGVLSIIAVRTASGSGAVIVQLALIIVACFVALALVFILHLVIAAFNGVPPLLYLKKTTPALLFAFSSRSSAATIPLTVEAQRSLGVGEVSSNLAASFGTCIGQNGCAGVYPTMLAILVGLVQGRDVWSLGFLLPLVIYVVIASIGTAGVGGGATNVLLMVLSLMGLPVELVAILMSVDFIIDMGRTLLNVSDSILAGYIVSKWDHEINEELLYDKVSG